MTGVPHGGQRSAATTDAPRVFQDDFWLDLGLAFPHKDGKGFNIMLQPFPPDGKIVCREVADDEPQQQPARAGNEAVDDKKDPAAAQARGNKRRANRGALSAHLPHVDVTIAPEDTNCPCCRAPMHVIGEETSQRLDVVTATPVQSVEEHCIRAR